jgi:adenylate cyclase
MPDLIAQGPTAHDRWRRELPAAGSGSEIVIGRVGADWNVPWDSKISRSHVRLSVESGDRVQVHCLPTARNPLFHHGQNVRSCQLVTGDHFVIGETTFAVANRPGVALFPAAGPLTEHLYDHTMLRQRRYRDSASRIDILSRLPELITGSGSDEELLVRVTSVLMQATPSASAVAIAIYHHSDDEPLPTEPSSGETEILHYDSRLSSRAESPLAGQPEGPPVSSRLVQTAVERRESILHLWSQQRGGDREVFTIAEGLDWAFCVPLRNRACPGWAIYVTGQWDAQSGADFQTSLRDAADFLQDDMKFAELVGTTIGNLRQSLQLERRQAALRRFFSPFVMDALAGRDSDEVLSPRATELSVMFCDLRGFSLHSEQHADQLFELLQRVSDSLGIMTGHILDTGGVIGDFHGDSAMGFWGWPLTQSDLAVRAVTAATRILYSTRRQSVTDAFPCGIGIASGRAVAGRIGTVDQVKVTAFGPVVNLANRLERMAKRFGTEIVIDQATALAIRKPAISKPAIGKPEHGFRIRRLATVRPDGMQNAVDVYQLLSEATESPHRLTDDQIEQYHLALAELIEGNWTGSRRRLESLPTWDRPKDILLKLIQQHADRPPTDWDGVIKFPEP